MSSAHTLFVTKEDNTIAYFNNNQKRPEKRFDPVNENIRYPEVLVIGPNGEQLGKMSSRDANQLAISYNLDLFCVAPQGNPPVCKILNYGKYLYEQKKANKASKKNQHIIETKQIQLHVNIGIHDLNTKSKASRKFIEDGNKVQVAVILKGREMTHKEIGEEVMNKFVETLSDVAEIEKPAVWEGKWYQLTLKSKKK